MSDKKKKGYVLKEFVSPRKPVILKSDRETPKEPSKEKPEKEKQPTILIKPREVSNAKEECQQSVKSSQFEKDTVQPSKIAQNEQKEKKLYEQQVKYMSKPMKLLDEYMEFNSSAQDFLSDSSTSYLVVGIIGTQSVGKSMIMNLIALDQHNEDICKQILNSHDINYDEPLDLEKEDQVDISQSMNKKKHPFPFKMQDLDQIERGVHCTKGIDLYVTKERVILLDCQPLWSCSLLDEGAAPGPPRNANSTIVDCLQVASFLMAVCHVVIAAQDWFEDYNFVKYIQTAEMLMPNISVTNTGASSDGQETDSPRVSSPHLLLVHNRCQLEDFLPETVRLMQDFYKKAFQRSNLQLQSGLSMYNEMKGNNNFCVDQVCKGYSVKACGTPFNMFLLPEIYDDYDNKEIYRGHLSFEQLARRLRWTLLGASRHQIGNVPNLSEKAWLQYCNKAWETIRKCNFFIEYERFLP